MIRRLLVGASAVATLFFPASAWASGLAVTPTVPAHGGTYNTSTGPYGTATRIDYEAEWPAKLSTTLFFEVATQSTPGQDGTLASEFVVDQGYLSPGDAFPTRYKGNWYASSFTKPGTYYIQFYAYTNCGQTVASPCTSDVFTFTVTAPTAQPQPTPQPQPQPSADQTPPRADVYAADPQRVRQSGLRFSVECNELCSVGVAASIRINGRTYRFSGSGATLQPSERHRFRLTLNARGRNAVKTALRSHKRLRASLSVAAIDAARNEDGGATYTFRIVG